MTEVDNARRDRYAAAIREDAERPQGERRGIIPGVMEVADAEQAELRTEIERLKGRKSPVLSGHVRAGLLDALTEALMRWNERGLNPEHAAMRRLETVRENAHGRAEAALDALLEHLNLGDAEAWCKACRRVWEGPHHACGSDAERRLAHARQVHEKLCPLAIGTLKRDAFTCGLCEVLDSPVIEADESEVMAALWDVLSHIRRQGHEGWKMKTCLVTDEQLNRWRQVAGVPSVTRCEEGSDEGSGGNNDR